MSAQIMSNIDGTVMAEFYGQLIYPELLAIPKPVIRLIGGTRIHCEYFQGWDRGDWKISAAGQGFGNS